MTPFKHLSLRNRLSVLILSVLIPLLILQFVAIVSRYERAIEAELRASADFADAMSVAFKNYLRDLWSTEYTIALAFTAKQGQFSPDEMENLLYDMMTVHPAIQGLAWVSPEGIVKATTQVNPDRPFAFRGKNIIDRDYMQRILLGEDELVADLFVNENNELTLPVARAIRLNGQLSGVVVAGIDIEQLDFILPSQRGGSTCTFGLIDQNGVIVYHSNHPGLTIEQRQLSESSPAFAALAGSATVARSFKPNADEKKHLGVYIPISPIRWVAFTMITRDEVLANARFETIRDILVLVLVAAFAAMVALRVGSNLLRPIMVIQQTAQAISNGELTARTEIKGADELAKTGQIFDEMADRIQELEVSRTRFLQTAAHELRNPMAGIKGILSLVRRRMTQGKPLGDIAQMLEVMDREIDRLSALLNQILEAFRTQRDKGQLALNLKKVNLVDVVFSTLKPFQLTVTSCRFVREITTQSEIWVAGDAARLEEVVRNLLSNAVKYSPNGGEIRIQMGVEHDQVVLSVRDQGIGIPTQQLSRIFDCFYRASNLEKRDPGGMGLGLYICKEIIEGHDGEIWAESNEGQGSSFFIKLPLYKNKEEL